ncbi:MAG: DsbA family oxidoreductase [Magnetospirillum sp. WYHS-4]
MQDQPLVIDVVFDAICPWCYVGKRRLEAALAQRPAIPAVRRWHPFLLNPQMPQEGMDWTAYVTRKFGGEARLKRVFDAIVTAGESIGIPFAFERIRRTPSTIDAHRLVRRAALTGRGADTVEALFRAYFLEGLDTGDRDVLVAIGEGLGLDGGELRRLFASQEDVTAIYDENARAHRLGINGVPSYMFNGQLAISGAQEQQVLVRMLDLSRVARESGFTLTESEGGMSRP